MQFYYLKAHIGEHKTNPAISNVHFSKKIHLHVSAFISTLCKAHHVSHLGLPPTLQKWGEIWDLGWGISTFSREIKKQKKTAIILLKKNKK